jgi:hypothetical protein
MSKSFVTATILCFVMGTGAAFAQAPTPAAPPSSTTEMSKPDKRAVPRPAPSRRTQRTCTAKLARSSDPSVNGTAAKLCEV